MDFESIITRIKEVKSVRDDQEVAAILGLSKGAFSERKRRNSIPKKELELFCERESINMHWILTGEGLKSKEIVDRLQKEEWVNSFPRVKKLVTTSSGEGDHLDKDFILIPQMTGEISAGGGRFADDSIEIKIAFRKEWIQRKGSLLNMSLIRVTGDSMEPTLCSGDLVLVDHGRNYIDPQGGIYAIALDNTIMIKRVQVIYPSRELKIISDNSRYEPAAVAHDSIVINGKVIWFGREIEK